MSPPEETPSQAAIARIEALVRDAESLPDPHAREAALELVRAVLALHATALERMVAAISGCDGGARALEAVVSDDLVSSVLALHGVHPESVETRVRRAFDKLCVFFDSRGGRIELLSLDSEGVRLRVSGSRPGFGAAAHQAIEDAIYQAAPEIGSVEIEGAEDPAGAGFVPLEVLAGVTRMP